MVSHGGEVGPGRVAAEEFDDAGAEDEAEEEEGECEADEEGWDIATGRAG